MTLYLGVDGGGTGCRAVVADADGHRLGEGHAGPANIVTDPEGAAASIVAAVSAALGGRAGGVRAVMGLAGANVPGAAERLLPRLPYADVRVVSDAVTALRGAFGGAEGIAATVGTGSVFASFRGGPVRLIGGWGLTLGDEGSGAWIGRRLLAQALRARDRTAALTPLLEEVLQKAGGAHGLVGFARTASPADFGRFAQRLVEQATDPAAEEILAEADCWILRGIDHLSEGGDLPVAFLGGLGPVFAARLRHHYAGRIRTPLGSALDGALWMARTGTDIAPTFGKDRT